ncbi:globin-like [Physella acuta]|uniref:globin-like n=1 Tax=Physella acuta TaxID=109671 RepID=UPI0027DD4C0C|nr:globin-like [Physella acuta]XP_059165563.1 globin-like [Physella acuta]
MALADNDKKALESSWKKLVGSGADGKQNAGINLVLWMFENVPNMRDKFSKFNANQPDAALKGDAEFLKQVQTIVGVLDTLIGQVNNPGQCTATMEKLAKQHINMTPSIGLEYFGPLQQNIHLFLEKSLGVGSGSDEVKAWTNFLGAFNDILKKA